MGGKKGRIAKYVYEGGLNVPGSFLFWGFIGFSKLEKSITLSIPPAAL